jgi:hypothetical protein
MTVPTDPAAARAGLAAPLSQHVADDLAGIFPESAGAPEPRRLRLGGRARTRAEQTSGRRAPRAARLGALAAVALVGVSAGAVLTKLPARKAEPAPPAAARQIAIVQGPPAQPALAPLATLPINRPAPVTTPVAAPVTPAPAPTVKRIAAHAKPARRAPRLVTASTACGRGGCSRATVLAADARLRRAYAGALHAGVSQRALLDYRDRWWALRRRAPHEPARVVAGYRQMAAELDRMAARQRKIHYVAPPHPGWRKLELKIAEFWR